MKTTHSPLFTMQYFQIHHFHSLRNFIGQFVSLRYPKLRLVSVGGAVWMYRKKKNRSESEICVIENPTTISCFA